MRLLVAGKDLKHHTAAGLLKHLLQHTRVVTHLSPVHLFDDVTHMEQTLLVDHPPVEDAGDHQLSVLNTERHTLTKQQKSETRSQNTPSTFRIWSIRFHDLYISIYYFRVCLICTQKTVNAILPNALQPLCGCPPCGWHQLVHYWWAAPWKHKGSRAESHTSERPQSHAFPTETDHQKHSVSVTNQTVYYSHLIWPVSWSAAVYLEVRLVEYVWQLCGGVAAVCEGAQLSQDVLHQLHIIVPHGLQSCLLQTLCTLEDQSGFGSHIHHQLLFFMRECLYCCVWSFQQDYFLLYSYSDIFKRHLSCIYSYTLFTILLFMCVHACFLYNIILIFFSDWYKIHQNTWKNQQLVLTNKTTSHHIYFHLQARRLLFHTNASILCLNYWL